MGSSYCLLSVAGSILGSYSGIGGFVGSEIWGRIDYSARALDINRNDVGEIGPRIDRRRSGSYSVVRRCFILIICVRGRDIMGKVRPNVVLDIKVRVGIDDGGAGRGIDGVVVNKPRIVGLIGEDRDVGGLDVVQDIVVDCGTGRNPNASFCDAGCQADVMNHIVADEVVGVGSIQAIWMIDLDRSTTIREVRARAQCSIHDVSIQRNIMCAVLEFDALILRVMNGAVVDCDVMSVIRRGTATYVDSFAIGAWSVASCVVHGHLVKGDKGSIVANRNTFLPHVMHRDIFYEYVVWPWQR